MVYEISHRWTGDVLFAMDTTSLRGAVEAGVCKADLSGADLFGANLSWADLSGADLSKAELSGANLFGANLSKADLFGANLSKADLFGANLSKADLSGANLFGANLSKADLSKANLSKANLSKADLSKADLRIIKHDFWSVLLQAIPEVPFLRQALIDGRVDGSTYRGPCACLCGTLAHAQGKETGEAFPFANSESPIERFFLAIRPGDTPEQHPIAHIVLEWLDEFQALVAPAVPTERTPV